MKIAYLLSAHFPQDERVWHHQKPLLEEAGHEVFVIASRRAGEMPEGVFPFESMINKIREREQVAPVLDAIQPDLILCDTPLTVWHARYFTRRKHPGIPVLYDVTEFYPSGKELRNAPYGVRFLKKTILRLLFRQACGKVDGFIFGEKSKARLPRALSASTPFVFVPYYPDLKYFKRHPLWNGTTPFTLFYAGNLTADKGWPHVVEVAKHCAAKRPGLSFQLCVVAYDHPIRHSETLADNLDIVYFPFFNYPDYCREMGKFDLYLDLREPTRENRECLPIKLFDYMAFGKPVMFSRRDALSEAVPEISRFGHSVDPGDYARNADLILRLVDDRLLYQEYSENARRLSEENYNWARIQGDFLHFVQQFQRSVPGSQPHLPSSIESFNTTRANCQ